MILWRGLTRSVDGRGGGARVIPGGIRASELILADGAEQISRAAGDVYGEGRGLQNIPRKFEQLVYGINKPISRGAPRRTRQRRTQSKLLKAFSRRLHTPPTPPPPLPPPPRRRRR